MHLVISVVKQYQQKVLTLKSMPPTNTRFGMTVPYLGTLLLTGWAAGCGICCTCAACWGGYAAWVATVSTACCCKQVKIKLIVYIHKTLLLGYFEQTFNINNINNLFRNMNNLLCYQNWLLYMQKLFKSSGFSRIPGFLATLI